MSSEFRFIGQFLLYKRLNLPAADGRQQYGSA
jgi:hypothetical protein